MLRVAWSRVLRSAASSSQALAAVCHRGAGVLATGECSSRQPSQAQHPCFSHRSFAAQAGGGDEEEVREVGSARVKRLVDDILQLSLLEVADLTQILQTRLGIGALPVGGGFGGGGGQAAPAAEAAPAAPPVEEKTEFDLKLDGFEAAAKIKVIKEVRGMTDLGLKEAKELVEKSPAVLKKGLKKEEAEELKKKLEAVGAKVSLQ